MNLSPDGAGAGGTNTCEIVNQLNGTPSDIVPLVPSGISTIALLSEELNVTGAITLPSAVISLLTSTVPIPVTAVITGVVLVVASAVVVVTAVEVSVIVAVLVVVVVVVVVVVGAVVVITAGVVGMVVVAIGAVVVVPTVVVGVVVEVCAVVVTLPPVVATMVTVLPVHDAAMALALKSLIIPLAKLREAVCRVVPITLN